METLFLPAQDPQTAAKAAEILKNGGLVALPTETVYGLGANGLDGDAVLKIFEAKGRPQDNPLILHVAQPEDIREICDPIPETAWRLAERFWPGPLTMVLPCRPSVPRRTTAGLDTVAVRCPNHPTADHVRHDMEGRIDAIVDGGPCDVGVESTIVDLTGPVARLLRPGGVTPEQLRDVVGDLIVDKAVTSQIDKDAVVRAPGMKYKHYAPQGEVKIIAGPREKAAAYIRRHFQDGDAVLCFEEELPLYEGCNPTAYGKEADTATLAHGLFAALRDLDRADIRVIFARCPEGGGVAYAVQNRLRKAAGFQIVTEDQL